MAADISDIRILLLEDINKTALKKFAAAGVKNVEALKLSLREDELVDKIGDVDFLGIRSRTQITEAVMDAAPNLLAIGAFCIGTNQVDLDAAAIRGIPVFNSPYSNTRSVAELILSEIIMLMRDIPCKNAKLHRGEWDKHASKSFEVRGKTLGIVGYGNIGSQLSILAESLGMRVYYYDIVPKLPLGNAMPVASLADLLSQSDIVTLHVPETPETLNMISAHQIAIMKNGAVLLNASRGTVVDLNALADAIRSEHLSGAAIDVYPAEPKSNDEPFESPLTEFDNVLLTPHIGGNTIEAQAAIGDDVSEKLLKYLVNGSTIGAVNFPQVALPANRGFHRLIHIHQNIPGVLAGINKIFGESMINVAGQYLQTNEKIGYVVIDVEAEYSEYGLRQLQKVDGTIRTRVLY
jgi:D-3-phosphoglycerate dehydrogenase